MQFWRRHSRPESHFCTKECQFWRRLLRPESHFCIEKCNFEERFWGQSRILRQKSRSWRGFYGFRVGSGRSVGRRFAFSISSASHQRHLSSSSSLYMVKGTKLKWENMLLGQHDTLRTMYHEKFFRLHKNSWRGHQRRWDEIAERRPLDFVAAPTFPI